MKHGKDGPPRHYRFFRCGFRRAECQLCAAVTMHYNVWRHAVWHFSHGEGSLEERSAEVRAFRDITVYEVNPDAFDDSGWRSLQPR